MDSFFASIEEREHPEYRGRPVIVGADPMEGKGRGVVSTANYEARRYGIHSAMPISRAYYLCPDGIFLGVNYALYSMVSHRIMDILRGYGTAFQQVSIDEAYLDLTGAVDDFQEARALAEGIKEEIRKRERLTASIGIGPSKVVAKIASDFRKPDGLTVVPPEEVEAFLAPLPVRKIPGVGEKTEEVLKLEGIRTIGDLQKRTPGELVELFGKWGLELHNLALGIDHRPVQERRVTKSIGRETTFLEDTADPGEVLAALEDIIAEVHQEAVERGYSFRTVTLKLRLKDFTTFTRSRTLARPTRDREVIKDIAEQLFSEFRGREVRLVGIRLTGLVRPGRGQTRLDDFCPD
ncbi:MAG: DNA polymerase IV [Acidobacteria bacterium]|nr:DNA polymerase IV [Acidobacteriota bacterium]